MGDFGDAVSSGEWYLQVEQVSIGGAAGMTAVAGLVNVAKLRRWRMSADGGGDYADAILGRNSENNDSDSDSLLVGGE